MPLYTVGEHSPELGAGSWVAPGARVMGRVRLGERVGVWFNAVIRGDVDAITIGAETNVQDGCVLHVDFGFPLVVGDRVTIGHGAMLHGCTLEDDVLVGMGATVLNGACIGRGSVIAAGALVREREVVPPLSLVAGVPAKLRRELPEGETLAAHAAHAAHYASQARRYAEELADA